MPFRHSLLYASMDSMKPNYDPLASLKKAALADHGPNGCAMMICHREVDSFGVHGVIRRLLPLASRLSGKKRRTPKSAPRLKKAVDSCYVKQGVPQWERPVFLWLWLWPVLPAKRRRPAGLPSGYSIPKVFGAECRNTRPGRLWSCPQGALKSGGRTVRRF